MPRRRGGKKIDFTHWTSLTGRATAFSAGVIAVTMAAALHEPETLLRMRGNIVAWLDAVGSTPRWVSVGVGVILVPEGTGTTVLWSPLSDPDAPWIDFAVFSLGLEHYTADVIDSPGITSFRQTVDSKAMRIVRNQEFQFVAENSTISGASAINVEFQARALSGK